MCVSVFPMLVVGLLPISKADQFSTIHMGEAVMAKFGTKFVVVGN